MVTEIDIGIKKESNPYIPAVYNVFEDGLNELERPAFIEPANPQFVLHRVQQKQDLTQIAYLYYKDIEEDASKLCELIASANNMEQYHDISSFVGKEIKIPDWRQYKLNRDSQLL